MTAIVLLIGGLLGVLVASEPALAWPALIVAAAGVLAKRLLDARIGHEPRELVSGEEVERQVAERLGYALPRAGMPGRDPL